MLKTMLKPFFKRFLGLFFSMVFVSMLSVALLCCFGSSIVNTKNHYINFVNEYQDMDELVSTQFVRRENLDCLDELTDVIDKYDSRLTVDCYLKRPNRTLVARVFSYDDDPNSEFKNQIFKRYVLESTPYATKAINFRGKEVDVAANISVCRKFAKNNNFKLGDVVELGFLNMYANFYIAEIVETPEGIYPRANNYIWSDNHDFGYIYASEVELSKGLRVLGQMVHDRIESGDTIYKEYYEKAIAVTGITIPDLVEAVADDHFVSHWSNQVLVKNKEGVKLDDAVDRITARLEKKGMEVKGTTVRTYMPHIAYMDRALAQVQIAAVFLPVFFYTVAMIVVGLFINQIIKAMTPQIGIFVSVGVGKWDIIKLFLIYTVLMAIASVIIGAPAGFALNIFLSGIMKNTYSIPTINSFLNPWVVGAAAILLIIFTIITTLISTQRIFKITPKDATISNEAKRKRLPAPVERFIDKAPMNIKLGTNSILQNPRRFFVSTFSIFASLVMILLATLFGVSKNELVGQSVDRRLNYDAQVYLTAAETKEDVLSFYEGGKVKADGSGFIEDFVNCYYTYLKVDNTDHNVYVECLAVDVSNSSVDKLIHIPNSNGHGKLYVPENGVILPKTVSNELNAKKGDYISINNKRVLVCDISYQYFHPITYLSLEQMEKLEVSYVTSYIMNVTTEADLQHYIAENKNQSLTVFTSSLSKDLHNIFDAMDVMIAIMVAFSIGMAFIILTIMSQNALMEQQRQLTVLRAIGFTVMDISNFWTIQSVGQLFFSALFGLPAGALSIYILLSLASSNSQVYPFVFSWPTALMALGFILVVLLVSHLIAMRIIASWNIADNTRSRE